MRQQGSGHRMEQSFSDVGQRVPAFSTGMAMAGIRACQHSSAAPHNLRQESVRGLFVGFKAEPILFVFAAYSRTRTELINHRFATFDPFSGNCFERLCNQQALVLQHSKRSEFLPCLGEVRINAEALCEDSVVQSLTERLQPHHIC
jgi:hypothetical protein